MEGYWFIGAVDTHDGCIRLKCEKSVLSGAYSRFKNKQLSVHIQEHKNVRSLAQNRYLWGVCYPAIQAHYLHTQGEIMSLDCIHAHNLTSIQGLEPKVKYMYGQQVITFGDVSSRKMSTKAFAKMVDKLVAFYAEQGLAIPEAGEYNYLNKV